MVLYHFYCFFICLGLFGNKKDFPTNIYLFKVNNRNSRKMCDFYRYVFLSLRLNIFYTFASVSIVDFDQVNVNWIIYAFLKSQRTYFQYGNFFLKGLLC